MAADVGKRLLAEVEEIRLDEILQVIRGQEDAAIRPFNFAPLDNLVQAAAELWPANSSLAGRPIVELLSLTAGEGKTRLLYHLCAKAVLPHHMGGQQAAVVVVDPDGQFSVDCVAAQVQTLLRQDRASTDIVDLDEDTLSALKHIHIFQPQSLASTSTTLDTLPDYLLTQNRHYSYDRQVSFIAVDTVSTFYWQDRSQTDNSAFLAATGEGPRDARGQSGYKQFFNSVKSATAALCCPAIVTTWNLSPPQAESNLLRSHRHQLPDCKPNLRLVIRRLPVRQYPPGVDVEQALRESVNRQEVVDRHRFECFVNHSGLEERHLRTFSGRNGGVSFSFSVTDCGLKMESEAMDETEEG